MQHPDEGMIHSWLDGALSAEDSARVEAHVAECSRCASAVAEARGFIAASSRILTALDDIPRGVIPAMPTRKRDLRVFWRAAAAMLVVAGGSLIVLREGGQDARVGVNARDTATFVAKAIDSTAVAEKAESPGSAGAARVAAPQSNAAPISQRRTVPPTTRAGQATPSGARDLSARGESGGVSASTGAVGGRDVAGSTNAPMTAVAYSALSEAPLKVLKVERAIGSRYTTYEVAPGDTVTLTETEVLKLQAFVTTGAATAQREARVAGARSVAPMRAGDAAATPPAPPLADSQRAASATALVEATLIGKAAAMPAQARAGVVAPKNTISWTEPTTGKTLTLSGNIPVERLQEIRRRIEKEKADSSKKAP